MRHGGEKRGNSRDRRNRKMWLLLYFGDGKTCECVHCGIGLDYSTIEADRIVPGGSYRHENIQPACRRCNRTRSDNVDWNCPLEWIAA